MAICQAFILICLQEGYMGPAVYLAFILICLRGSYTMPPQATVIPQFPVQFPITSLTAKSLVVLKLLSFLGHLADV